VLGVAGAAGAALLFASAAYACTNFRGTMTVTAGSGSTKVVGSGLGMSYCAGYPKDNAAAPAGGAHGTSGGTIKISVAPSTGCNTLRLAADTYHANFANGKAYTFTVNATTHKRTYSGIKIDCMNLGRGISSLTPATLSVPATGVASANFKLPGGLLKSGPSDAAAVCLANTGATIGLQAPIIIV
jgi:hypothetical protein